MSRFLERIIERAKTDKKTIVLAEGNDVRTIKAAAMAIEQNVADIIILGEKASILKMAEEEKVDISAATLINPVEDVNFKDFVNKFYEMRKAKGMTPEKAEETLKNTLCMYVQT